MTEKKMTYAQAFDNVLNGILNEETLARIADAKERELKKHNGETKKQKENEATKPIILEVLTSLGQPSQVGAIVKALNKIEGYEDYSTPKVTPILRSMMKDGTVVNVVDKKVSLYAVA